MDGLSKGHGQVGGSEPGEPGHVVLSHQGEEAGASKTETSHASLMLPLVKASTSSPKAEAMLASSCVKP
jgi:hypothetical protein